MNKIKELEDKIKIAQDAYYNGSEIISDDEYDALIYELSLTDPNNPILLKVGADPVEEWIKEKHLTQLGSLEKVNTPSEMSDWISDKIKNKPVVVLEKLDGLSLGLQYEEGKLTKAVLRGNSFEGENIYQNAIKMLGIVKKLPTPFNGTIRGETILTKTNHQKYFENYSNPRNAASGLSRSLSGDKCEHLSLMCYDVIGDIEFKTEIDRLKFLSDNGFKTPNYKLCKNDKEVNELWKEYQDKIRDSLDYEIDGLVCVVSDVETQNTMNDGSAKPRFKKAFKFANQFVKTIVNNITWEIGNSGRVTPRCWFEPVLLLGSTIEKASVYNIAYIEKIGLGIGAEVLVCKANEITPRIEKVIKSSGCVETMPVNCPCCGYKLEMVGENLQCFNSDNCFGQITGRVQNWIKELNILEIGTGLIDKLVKSNKVITVADLYTLAVDDLASLDRMGKKSAENVYNSLWNNNPVNLELFIGGLSIPFIGSSTIKLLIEAGYDNLGAIRALNKEQIEAIKGIGPVKAESLVNGLVKYKAVIDNLLLNGVKIKDKVVGNLTGKSFALTGTMVNKRSLLEQRIIDAGGTVKSSVGKGLGFLVINDLSSVSNKTTSAKKFGTALITEDDLLNML